MSKRSKTDLWMPVYIGDYLADTMRLSTIQHGAYFLLMMEYWRQGPLPDDADELSSIARADRKVWDKSIWPVLKRYFHKENDGLLHQKRADAERAFADEKRSKRIDAANARWRKETSNRDANAYANASRLDEQSSMQTSCKDDPTCASRPRASPSPSPSSLRSENTLTSFVTPAAPSSHAVAEVAPDLLGPGNVVPLAPDARTVLFRQGLDALVSMTGKTQPAARRLMGKWLKATKDNAQLLSAILFECSQARPIEAIPWIEGAIRNRTGSKLDAMARDWRLDEIDLDAAAEEDCRRQGI
ncbi:DUF1376 domain-containing protein [Novacetimonas hansenii]|uniref:YdaU family protein n=1 Tax=Novacetimonas hansenii TaxID=436 RepID=UPI00177A8300|nr:DUF1376 domain-containing protein [Novacetimonas hansenii]QOF94241.1 DUF1376 domain-containing protein [Novacetimonas hansenii]